MNCFCYEMKKIEKAAWDNGERDNCTTCKHWDGWRGKCGKEEELKETGRSDRNEKQIQFSAAQEGQAGN